MTAPQDVQQDQPIQPWIELSSELLEVIAAHPAFPIETANREFQGEVRAIRTALAADPTARQAMITGVDVQEALARYGEFAATSLGGMTSNLRDIASLLLTYAEPGTNTADPALEDLRSKVLSAKDPADLQLLRQEIADRLDGVRRDSEERHQRSTELTEKLQDRITVLENYVAALPAPTQRPSPKSGTDSNNDPCTGLPNWDEADKVIETTLASETPMAIAVFYVHRMNYVNARFGSTIGDKVLLMCSQHLATTLIQPADYLFRWKGPAFIALLEREDAAAQVEHDLQRLLATPLSQYLETATRTVYLPIKLTGSTVPATETTPTLVRDWIERYILRSSTDNRLTE